MDLKKELDLAVYAAKKAGDYLRNVNFKEIKVLDDLNKDIKLDVDKNTEKVIYEVLKESSYGILAEEGGNLKFSESKIKWIVDPLDGTINYYKGIEQNAISIGLYDGLTPLLGVVYDYNNSDMYKGIIGEGAWLNNENIIVSDVSSIDKSVIGIGFHSKIDVTEEHLSDFVRKIMKYKKVRCFGCASLSLAYVACGKLEAYIQDGIKFWDFAGGLAIVVSAGGKFNLEELEGKYNFKIFARNNSLKEG